MSNKSIEFSSYIIPDHYLGHFDMLRHKSRNHAYANAISYRAHRYSDVSDGLWVDLGCGSGLLGCLVAKKLKNKVVSFECVPALAKIARETIRRNHLEDYVTVWLTHTSEIDSEFMIRTFGTKAVCVISELLDTTLLGEGLYEGLEHARRHLLSPPSPSTDARLGMIPHAARVYVQAYSGECLSGYSHLNYLSSLGLENIPHSDRCTFSSGSTVQWGPFLRAGALPASAAVEVLHFNFTSLGTSGSARVDVEVTGEVDAWVAFWTCCCACDASGNCATGDYIGFHTQPSIAPGDNSCDHWRQAVFFQPRASDTCMKFAGEERSVVKLIVSHDQDDIWVTPASTVENEIHSGVTKSGKRQRDSDEFPNIDVGLSSDMNLTNVRPVCTCGLHACFSCFHIRHLNSAQMHAHIVGLENTINSLCSDRNNCGMPGGCVLLIGDSILAPVLVARAIQTYYRGENTRRSNRCGWRVVCLFSSNVAMLCGKRLLECNISTQFNSDLVKWVCMEHYDGEDNGWIDEISKAVEGVWENICTIHSAPYFSSLHDEWAVEHFLFLCSAWSLLRERVLADDTNNIIYESTRFMKVMPRGGVYEYDMYVDMYVGVFTSEFLWAEYTGEINDVEGIDMSAINELMSSIPIENTHVTSIRLSQWGASVSGATLIGTMSLKNIIESGEWNASGQICVPSSTSDQCFHGVALYTTIRYRTVDIHELSGEPVTHPEDLQAFRCFQVPAQVPSGENFTLNVSCEIGGDGFVVSIIK